MNNNPGRTVSTFQISSPFSEAYLNASNAMNGLDKTGIMPFNPDIFSVAEFAAAEVTHNFNGTAQEQYKILEKLKNLWKKPSTRSCPIAGSDTPPISEHPASDQSTVEAESFFNVIPAHCRPLPKITGKRAVPKRKSVGTVLTNTPYKKLLEEEKNRKIEAEDKKTLQMKRVTKKKDVMKAMTRAMRAIDKKKKHAQKREETRIPRKIFHRSEDSDDTSNASDQSE
ncbi:hypothetical protein JTB14_009273 [Gonioctena quinquepunctata]|nr:hypothetical protein JTB14_009273 [Gonioctena quinquepunctata]